jgi:hypothetical protein
MTESLSVAKREKREMIELSGEREKEDGVSLDLARLK